ncbi:hypothetical protein BV22DRAFT_795774 [Leucogyrophana mollusca]|uniref:Uncharacterized protein n=1 Tax=Leucogyrophana mollusca TaxID=85980 RepID=A0ACB8B4A7_9AGAM|nr:hypothetical protein BV22DRAFT_795774 [Leucogyrophana mollusca]
MYHRVTGFASCLGPVRWEIDVIADKGLTRTHRGACGAAGEACLACCAERFVGCIARCFIRYAYIEIALYRKPHVSARDLWNMLNDRGKYISSIAPPVNIAHPTTGTDALVNDSLDNMTLTWGAYAVALLSSLFAYMYDAPIVTLIFCATHPRYTRNTPGVCATQAQCTSGITSR